MIPFIKKNLAPNRLAVYFTAIAALALALVGIVDQLSWTSLSAALGSLAVLAGVVAVWLRGWQQYESALYQRDLIAFNANAQADAREAAVQAAQAVSKPGTGPKVTLPR